MISNFEEIRNTLFSFSDKTFFIFMASILFLIMVVWELISKYKRVDSSVRASSYRTNLTNLVFNNLIMIVVSVHFFYTLASYRSLDILPYLGRLTGVSMNSILGLTIQFIILDFLIYIWHVMNHKIDFFWNFHKAHHCDHDLNTSTGIRFHIGEILFSLLYKSIIVLFLGIPPEIMIIFEFITTYAALFHHSNIRIPGEDIIRFFLIMPSHHATHHSVPRQHHDSNYGVIFSVWDYVFRTHSSHQPKYFGLDQTPKMNFFQLLRFSLSPPYLIVVIIFFGSLFFLRWYSV